MDFWGEYFEMRKQVPVYTAGACIVRLSCLAEADRRWNPNYERDKEAERFNPLHPISKRRLRYTKMYWALREGRVAK